MAADIIKKRVDKIMEVEKVKKTINSSFKQLSEISDFKISADASNAFIKSLNVLKTKNKFKQMVANYRENEDAYGMTRAP